MEFMADGGLGWGVYSACETGRPGEGCYGGYAECFCEEGEVSGVGGIVGACPVVGCVDTGYCL